MLKNKLGIENNAEPAQAEERLSKLAAVKLFDSGLLDSLDPGTYGSSSKSTSAFNICMLKFGLQLHILHFAR